MNTFIIDDEPAAIEALKFMVDQTPYLTYVGSSADPVEALTEIQKQPVDLVFLDIHMPKLSGMDFLKIVRGKMKVIITTAHAQYAVDGYEYGVVDYLMKPIPFDRFLKATQKLISEQTATPVVEAKPAESQFVFVKADAKGKYTKVDFKDIVYVEGLKNYLSIFTDSDRIITLLSIKEFFDKLADKGFIRVHKSFIVALNRIKQVEGNQIVLKDKRNVPLGDAYRSEFFTILNQFMMESQKKGAAE